MLLETPKLRLYQSRHVQDVAVRKTFRTEDHERGVFFEVKRLRPISNGRALLENYRGCIVMGCGKGDSKVLQAVNERKLLVLFGVVLLAALLLASTGMGGGERSAGKKRA